MNNMFQEIFDKLQDYLPNEWSSLVFYAAYFDGSYSMKYYIKDNKNEYVDCYNTIDLPSIQFTKLFISLDKVISQYRKELDDNKKWSVMTMVINSDGNMKTNYTYEDISESFIKYEDTWKKEYLL